MTLISFRSPMLISQRRAFLFKREMIQDNEIYLPVSTVSLERTGVSSCVEILQGIMKEIHREEYPWTSPFPKNIK
jgi:hypothetical protein